MAHRKNHKKSLPPLTVGRVTKKVWELLGGPGDAFDWYLWIAVYALLIILMFVWAGDFLAYLALKLMGFL